MRYEDAQQNVSYGRSRLTMTNLLTNIQKTLNEFALVSITDKDGIITYANKEFCKMAKYSQEELVGQNHRIIKSGYHPPEFYTAIWKVISSGRIWKGEIKNKAKDGTFYWVKTVITPLLDEEGRPKEYVSIRVDITDRKNAEEKLRQSNKKIEEQYKKQQELAELLERGNKALRAQAAKLQELDKVKEQFSSMVAHELKTPLVPIQAYCELLLSGQFGDLTPKQMEKLEVVYESALSLSQLIQDVLDVHKLELGEMRFSIRSIFATELIDQSIKRFKLVADARNVNLVDRAEHEIMVQCDPERIMQVINNLVSNALKFVPNQEGKIEVCARRDNGSILFTVNDNGTGIPKEKQYNLFKKFYQVDTSLSRNANGTGLGLAICKGIVEGHNGRIWVESEEGKGTAFYFTIPVN